MTYPAPLTITDLNALPIDLLVERLGHLFEHSPWIVEQTLPNRPFANRETFHAALCLTLRNATPEQQLALVRAHPDLVGRAALNGSLTSSSTAEQRAAGLDANDLSSEEIEAFQRNNAEYKGRFGFPFVICALENKKAAILAGFERRLPNTAEEELATALGEIERIAWYRLADAITDEG